MNKTYPMSIKVREEELYKLKLAAKLEVYSSYSEFVRRTALKEAGKILSKANIYELHMKTRNEFQKES